METDRQSMARVNCGEDPALPTKHSLDDNAMENVPPKKQKLGNPDAEIHNNGVRDPEAQVNTRNGDVVQEGEGVLVEEGDGDGKKGDGAEAVAEAEAEHNSSNGKSFAVVSEASAAAAVETDRKGKGVFVEEESEEDEGDSNSEEDNSTSDDGDNLSDDDLSDDDPLAEVDLNNILPSRTRRRVVHPGAYDASILASIVDSEDSDA